MPQRTVTILALAVLATVPRVTAKILSYRTFNAVGVANLESTIDNLKGLSWVKGVGAEDVNSKERSFDQSFYLGTPDDFDFGSTGACALFFTQTSDRVKFGDGDPRNTEGTCKDAMTDSCISAMVDRAKKVDMQGLSGKAACEKLQKDFSDNLDSACTSFAQGSRWSGIKAQALSGDGSPDAISDQQNITSTCWPVLPKSDDLTFVESTNATGNLDASTLIKNFFSITPILTVFFPGNGNSSLVSRPEAQLTCVKTIDLTTASNATQSPTDNNKNAAGQLVSGKNALWVGLMSITLSAFFI
ncbi:hypothetical protein NEMBOFW57_008269 [Staphylotrichum longicolle]|uniref:Uncharacterized protein n=1 Tax=Staphylotrichum longicolle TaxID=669026 RepID=A0AAD4ER12_9PEZI|nr:hypothetical protein NEMBOFW57_008269 [Staphylotrichum longicolle]